MNPIVLTGMFARVPDANQVFNYSTEATQTTNQTYPNIITIMWLIIERYSEHDLCMIVNAPLLMISGGDQPQHTSTNKPSRASRWPPPTWGVHRHRARLQHMIDHQQQAHHLADFKPQRDGRYAANHITVYVS